MSVLGAVVVDPGVGGNLSAALLASPVFGGLEQSSAYSLSAEVLLNEPAFDEADRMGRVATIGVRAEAYFDKSGWRAILILGYEDGHGHGAVSAREQNGFEFFAMLLGGAFGPEEMVHRCEVAEVGGRSLSDPDRQPSRLLDLKLWSRI